MARMLATDSALLFHPAASTNWADDSDDIVLPSGRECLLLFQDLFCAVWQLQASQLCDRLQAMCPLHHQRNDILDIASIY